MAEIVNLRGARKAAERARKKAEADANAVKFGRTGAEKAADTARAEKTARDWQAHRREPDLPE
jgi:hypothetical protein